MSGSELDPTTAAQLARLADVGMHTASLLHELRQPLFAVQAAAELGLERDGDRGVALRRVLDHMQHVRELVDRYAGLGRSDEPEQRLDLREPVLGAAAMLAHRAGRSDAVIRVDAPSASWVSGREAELRQVALNLIQNALDAVEGAPRREVTVRVRVTDDACVLQVEDTGPGIPGPLLDHVFEPFVSGKPTGKGTGLGLFITRTIVRAARGDVTIASSSAGTTVCARWPSA